MHDANSDPLLKPTDNVCCWLEIDSSIMLKAVTKFGDPVELSAGDARSIADALVLLANRLDPTVTQ